MKLSRVSSGGTVRNVASFNSTQTRLGLLTLANYRLTKYFYSLYFFPESEHEPFRDGLQLLGRIIFFILPGPIKK